MNRKKNIITTSSPFMLIQFTHTENRVTKVAYAKVDDCMIQSSYLL
jgi:hypothetical protein